MNSSPPYMFFQFSPKKRLVESILELISDIFLRLYCIINFYIFAPDWPWAV